MTTTNRKDPKPESTPKRKPKKDREWLARKVAELRAELEKLPADRQDQFRREMGFDGFEGD